MKIRNSFKYLLVSSLLLISSVSFSQKQQNEIRQRQKLAYEYEQLGDLDSALRIFKELYEKNPNNYIAFDGVKRVLISQNRLDDAIEFVEGRLKIRYDLRIHSDLGAIYYMNENKKEAFHIWDELLEKNPRNASAYQYVARAMVQNRLIEKAIAVYQTGRNKINNENLFSIEIANLYAAQNDYKNATIEFLKNFRKNPNQYTFIKLNVTRFVAEDPECAPALILLIKEEIKQNPKLFKLRSLLTDIYLTKGDYENAYTQLVLLDQKLSEEKNKKQRGKELFEFGNKVLNDDAFLFAEKAFNLLTQKYPKSIYAEQALFGLARSYQKQDNHEQALVAYEQLIQGNHRSYQAQEALFQIGDVKLYEQQKPAAAREAYLKILKFYQRGDKRDKATFRIGDCYFWEGNFAEARNWYNKPLASKNAKVNTQLTALYNIAQADLVEGNLDKATERINLILEKSNQRDATYDMILVNDALEWSMLLTENSKNIKSFGLYTQTILLEKQHKFKAAIDLLKIILNDYPEDPIADEALLKKADFSRKLGEYLDSINAYQLLLSNYPESNYRDLAKMEIGKIYEKNLAQTEKALQEYEAFLVEFPRSMYIEEVRRKIRQLEKNL